MFIEEPQLCKLIHFQGYPVEVQDTLVRGVPSMHICITFIPELLKLSNMERRVFGIRLLGHLANQYSIPQTLELCKLALRIGLTLTQGKYIYNYGPVLFPILRDNFIGHYPL